MGEPCELPISPQLAELLNGLRRSRGMPRTSGSGLLSSFPLADL
jgi:hypothetical protein